MRIGRWNNIVVGAWRHAISAAAAHTLLEIMIELHASSSEVRSYIHLVPDQALLPDADARKDFSRIMSRYEPYIACVGVVVAGGGFWASAMRSAVIGLRLLIPTPFDYKLHTSTDELFSWFPQAHFKRTGVSIAPHELRALLDEAERWQRGESDLPQ